MTKRGKACGSGSGVGLGAVLSEVTPCPLPERPSPQAPGWVQVAGRAQGLPCGAVRRRECGLERAGPTEEQPGEWHPWGCVGARPSCSRFTPHSRWCTGPHAPLGGGSGAAGQWRAWCLLSVLRDPCSPRRGPAARPPALPEWWLQAHSWQPVRTRRVRGPRVR